MSRYAATACAVLVALAGPAAAGRALLQAPVNTYNVFPGCTFYADSPIATSSEFSYLSAALDATGLNTTLSDLTSPVTLFAPTNEAIETFLGFENLTVTEFLASPLLETILLYHVSPLVFTNETVFKNGDVLPTLAGAGNNLTIAEANETITVIAYGSEGMLEPGSGQACEIVYYPIDAVLVPEAALSVTSESFMYYLEDLLSPASSGTPAELIFTAVAAGSKVEVAGAFIGAQSEGHSVEVTNVCNAVTAMTGGVPTILPVLDEIAQQSGCTATNPCMNGVMSALISMGNSASAATASLSNASTPNYPTLQACLSSTSSS